MSGWRGCPDRSDTVVLAIAVGIVTLGRAVPNTLTPGERA
jgi:hypothetical protein